MLAGTGVPSEASKLVLKSNPAAPLLSSLSAGQGSARLAAYAASKAFNLVLAESLWDELRADGVDVLAVRPGATRTPGYERSAPRAKTRLVSHMRPLRQVIATSTVRPIMAMRLRLARGSRARLQTVW